MSKKKVIRTSSLAARFYISDGWTREELEEIAPGAKVIDKFAGKPMGYFVYDLYDVYKVNLDKLMERCERVERLFNDYPEMSDRDFIRRYL